MLPPQRINLILFALLLAVGAGIYLLQQPQRQALLASLDPDDITRLVIETDDRAPLTFEKQASQWLLVQADQSVGANQEKIQQILSLLTTQPAKQFTPASAELEKYGLASPRIRLQLNDTSIRFGKLDPINNLRYVAIGEKVFLIKDTVYRHLLAEKSEFIRN